MDDASTQLGEARQLRLLIDRLPALIGYWDRHACNVIANNAHFDYFGMTPAEIRGCHIREIVSDEVFVANEGYLRSVLAGVEQQFESTLVDRHGCDRFVLVSLIPDVYDEQVAGFYLHAADVTARVRAEQARDEAVRLFELSMANAPIGTAVIDTAGYALQVNPALCELFGYRADEMVGTEFRTFVHPEELASSEADLGNLCNRIAPQIASERRFVRRDGSTIWVQRNAVLVPRAHDGNDVIVAQFQDVTARKQAEADLAKLAVTDPLTGLQNRHGLVDRIDTMRTAGQMPTAGIVFIDLDGFKQINDTYGHATGDAVLVDVARCLAAVVTAPRLVYRIGGDEFVVITTDAAPSDVAELARTIRHALTGNYRTDKATITLTASVGWTVGPILDFEELLRGADTAMYQDKWAADTDPSPSI